MNRKYVVGGCAALLLISSCWVFAQPGAQRGNQKEISTVVMSYLKALQAGRGMEVIELSHFHDAKERDRFQEDMKRRGALNKWDLKQELHLVQSDQKEDCVKALYLLPTRLGYLPKMFTVQNVDGKLKLLHEKRESRVRDRNDMSGEIVELSLLLNEWHEAEGVALQEKADAFRKQLREEVDALGYAERNGLRVVPGYGSLATRRAMSDAVKDMNNEELRAKMVKECKLALEVMDVGSKKSSGVRRVE